MMLRTVLSSAVAFALTAGALAQEKLKVGDVAPGLDILQWVKGSETKIEQGNVYVVEFWATWCAPCRKAIPHLTELQKQYADDGLTIIGVSTDEDVAKVPPFVRGQGDNMAYTVAIDKQNGTQRAWMEAAGQRGIPCSFIVDRKSRIAYIGHPAAEEFEATLKQVMTGRFDPKLQKQAEPALRAARSAKRVNNWLLASKHYEEVIKLDPTVFASVGLEQFEMFLVDMNDRTKAYGYARNTLMDQTFASDAGALQMLAEKIAKDPKIDQAQRDMDLALELAEAAYRLAGNNDAKSLATLAEVRYHRGEVEQAIELQKKAYFSATPRTKPQFKRVLATYQDAAQRASMVNKQP